LNVNITKLLQGVKVDKNSLSILKNLTLNSCFSSIKRGEQYTVEEILNSIAAQFGLLIVI